MKKVSSNITFEKIISLNSKFVKSAELRLVFLYSFFSLPIIFQIFSISYEIIAFFLYLKNKPINFDPKVAPNSQNLPEIIKLNFAINLITKKLMSKKKSVIGDNPLFHKLDEIEGVDIDTQLDFEFAEYLHKKYF